jgi:hypothetical protein
MSAMPMFPGAMVVPNFDCAARCGSVCIQTSSPLIATERLIRSWSTVSHAPGSDSTPMSPRIAARTSSFEVIDLFSRPRRPIRRREA